MDLTRLRDYFKPNEIEFRIGATTADKKKGVAVPYVTNRAIQERLDDVCGAENWRNEFKPWKENSQLCGISIKIDGEWVTKWDGAEDTHIEPIKGGLSGAMKRAAVQWGIGRYLYDIDDMWVDIVPYGKSYKFAKPPALPSKYLPAGVENEGYKADVVTEDDKLIQDIVPQNNLITKEQENILVSIFIEYGIKPEKATKFFKINKIEEMTQEQYKTYIDILKSNIPNFKLPELQAKPPVSEKEKAELEKVNAQLGVKK